MVAEPDVRRRHKARRPRCADARWSTVVHLTGSAADVLGALGTIGGHDVGALGGAKAAGTDRLAVVGDVGVGGGEPVMEVVFADDARDLDRDKLVGRRREGSANRTYRSRTGGDVCSQCSQGEEGESSEGSGELHNEVDVDSGKGWCVLIGCICAG